MANQRSVTASKAHALLSSLLGKINEAEVLSPVLLTLTPEKPNGKKLKLKLL
jgi:hypothetical protein